MKVRELLLAIMTPTLILAQSALDSWDNLKLLRPGQKIEVVDVSVRAFQGQFVSHSEESIVLRTDKAQVSVPRGDVVSVKNKEGPRRARNAWIGMAIGAAGGAAIGAIRGATYHEEGETGVFMLVWTPIGAGIGAGAGAMAPGRQVTIYRVRTLSDRNPASPGKP